MGGNLLLIDAQTLPWNDILSMADSDQLLNSLVEKCKVLLDSHACLGPVRDRSKTDNP